MPEPLPSPSIDSAASRAQVRRHIGVASVRFVVATTLLLVVYFHVPLGNETNTAGLAIFVLALVGFGIALAFQIRRIINDPVPRLRAAETLGIAIPAFIVLFALVYAGLAERDPHNFSEPLDRLSSLYFTVTVLATVGFGDIAAKTDIARVIVTVQMLLDLVLIGVVVKLVVGASRLGIERRLAEANSAAETGTTG